MISWILGILTGLGGPINNIIKNIRYLKMTETITKSSMEKARIKQEIAEAHDRQAIIVAEAGHRLFLRSSCGIK